MQLQVLLAGLIVDDPQQYPLLALGFVYTVYPAHNLYDTAVGQGYSQRGKLFARAKIQLQPRRLKAAPAGMLTEDNRGPSDNVLQLAGNVPVSLGAH